ncbi:hypothetical protein [Nostoc sp. UHCC 0252]|uniref:hypothetical protein n=1 Tax=Nostoc sp. UHCC 0252 TaxID=3110241 RepID=UPI002B1EB34C|nr:hypothetical protein [Nostoc sp. UHCC 0252]MEA5604950.1 hypothetical protein [Nostoc sp. UHCC 0252]
MAIVISLSSELEVRLREKAAQQGQDISFVATQLLEAVLEWEVRDSEAAIKGIQQGLEDFEAGRFRSFDDFADEQHRNKLLLEQSGIGEEVEIEIQDCHLIVRAASQSRQGWDEAFARMAKLHDNVLLDDGVTTEWEHLEWEWEW